MSFVRKYKALGEMAPRSKLGGGEFVRLEDYEALQARSKELERHLKILISLTTDLQDRLTNSCEDFEGEQYIGKDRDEDTAFVDAAREALAKGDAK